jgi:hypothetical protein
MYTTARVVVVALLCIACFGSVSAAQVIRPAKDGTIVDGGVYGDFDGVPDAADWYFNESSYEGSITLSRGDAATGWEHRVVWEYSLSTVSLEPPVRATLSVTIRPARIFPHPDVDVHVYSYPADLQETLADFNSGPTQLQGIITAVPYEDPAEHYIDVSQVVNAALSGGQSGVAFRFQVDPSTPEPASQAFIDSVDSDPTTKPFLTITESSEIPGDYDADGDVDDADYSTFTICMDGPGQAPGASCSFFDFDNDQDVDNKDFATFSGYFTGN